MKAGGCIVGAAGRLKLAGWHSKLVSIVGSTQLIGYKYT